MQKMPRDARKAVWRFDALWAFPTRMGGSTSFTDHNCLLRELDSELKRDLVERPTFPPYTGYVEIKYKLSDLEIALTNASTQLPLTGYIQLEPTHNIESDNLLRWFAARWIAVNGQLGRNEAYREWSRQDPAYRHVQVHGMPAVATRGPGKTKVCVRPDTPNLDSLFWPRSFESNIQSRCQRIMSHFLIRARTYHL